MLSGHHGLPLPVGQEKELAESEGLWDCAHVLLKEHYDGRWVYSV